MVITSARIASAPAAILDKASLAVLSRTRPVPSLSCPPVVACTFRSWPRCDTAAGCLSGMRVSEGLHPQVGHNRRAAQRVVHASDCQIHSRHCIVRPERVVGETELRPNTPKPKSFHSFRFRCCLQGSPFFLLTLDVPKLLMHQSSLRPSGPGPHRSKFRSMELDTAQARCRGFLVAFRITQSRCNPLMAGMAATCWLIFEGWRGTVREKKATPSHTNRGRSRKPYFFERCFETTCIACAALDLFLAISLCVPPNSSRLATEPVISRATLVHHRLLPLTFFRSRNKSILSLPLTNRRLSRENQCETQQQCTLTL